MYDSINSKYTYPNTNVIKNKLGIKDEVKLEEYERREVLSKLFKIRDEDFGEIFDIDRLKKIHKYLFSDIYEFAGNFREENITKDNFIFAQFQFIEENLISLLETINIEKMFNYSLEEKIKNISYYMTELNVLHPFREGNGRTIREFIRELLNKIGLDIDFTKIEYNEIIRVSKLAVIDDKEQIQLLKNNVIKI